MPVSVNTGVTGKTPSHAPVHPRFHPFLRGEVKSAGSGVSTIKKRALPFVRNTNAFLSMSAMTMVCFGAAAALDRMLTSILNAGGIRVRICALAKNSSIQVVLEKTISSSKKRSDKSSRKTCLSSERKDYIKVIIDDNLDDG